MTLSSLVVFGAMVLAGVNTRLGVDAETEVLLIVAEQYGLDDEKTRLLFAIRRVENGGPGVELGVGGDDPDHASRRMAHAPMASLHLQARYAAGTISKRYNGDLDAFAKRWCPGNAENWKKMIRQYTEKR